MVVNITQSVTIANSLHLVKFKIFPFADLVAQHALVCIHRLVIFIRSLVIVLVPVATDISQAP